MEVTFHKPVYFPFSTAFVEHPTQFLILFIYFFIILSSLPPPLLSLFHSFPPLKTLMTSINWNVNICNSRASFKQ